MKALSLALLAALLAGWGTPARAQALPAGDVESGRRMAVTWCANCHMVSREGLRRRSDTVPAFIDIARDPLMTETAIRVFLQTPHPRMPNFMLSRQETDDIVAYIQSLKR